MEEVSKSAWSLKKASSSKHNVNMSKRITWKGVGIRSLGILLVLLIWTLVTATGLVTPSLLPSPWVVFSTTIEMLQSGVLIDHTFSSLRRVIIGFLIAFGIALPLGLAMGMWGPLRKAVDPVIELLRPIPPIAIIPLGILWFGIGEFSKVFIIAYAAFFPIALNVMGGIRQVDKVHVKAAQTLGANKLQIFYFVTLRSAVPFIIMGMRSGISMAFISLVAAELIASNAGLGFLIQEARYVFRTDQVMVGMFTIGFVGFGINQLLMAAERYLVRWK